VVFSGWLKFYALGFLFKLSPTGASSIAVQMVDDMVLLMSNHDELNGKRSVSKNELTADFPTFKTVANVFLVTVSLEY